MASYFYCKFVYIFQVAEINCCLTLDEMSITPAMEFDKSSGTVLGNVTLPGHSGTATHILVFMLAGKCR